MLVVEVGGRGHRTGGRVVTHSRAPEVVWVVRAREERSPTSWVAAVAMRLALPGKDLLTSAHGLFIVTCIDTNTLSISHDSSASRVAG